MDGRTPRGGRGLKLLSPLLLEELLQSHPSRGAWIEIYSGPASRAYFWSHPSRGAWIEIVDLHKIMDRFNVAPLAGCVD